MVAGAHGRILAHIGISAYRYYYGFGETLAVELKKEKYHA
jgi:hypothetical protein